MSCISKILELKVEPIEKDFIDKLNVIPEGGGIYNGYEYLVTFSPNGFRCGYVAIPSSHPIEKEIAAAEYDVDVECHGGVTFNSPNHGLKKRLELFCADNWIGFDCGHYYDGFDIDSYSKYYGPNPDKFKGWHNLDGDVRDFNYVESECKSIIDQLIQMESVYS